jgi:GT2 family glycosyltransferase
MTELAVVIVSHNALGMLRQCLDSLTSGTALPGRKVLVVDNASADPCVASLAIEYPEVEFLFNRENRGFAAACNQGIAACRARFYLLLNPDTLVEDKTLESCLDRIRTDPEVGILGCRVNNPDGSLQRACRRRIPRPAQAWVTLTGLHYLLPRNLRPPDYNFRDQDEGVEHPVEAVSGSYLMFRREVIETAGLLDEQFFLYGEDLDFCYRAGRAGWKILYFPKAQIIHAKRGSSSTNPELANFHFYDAMRLFYLKHFAPAAGILERTAVLAGIRALAAWSNLRNRLGKPQVGAPD